MAIELDPEFLDAYHGCALCKFKSGDPQGAVEHLDVAVEMLDGADLASRKNYGKFYWRYLRAICNKVLGNFDAAEDDYRKLKNVFAIQDGRRISKEIMAMVLMPMERSRKTRLQFVDMFKDIIDNYEVEADRKVLSKYYLDFTDRAQVYIADNKHPKWQDKHLGEVLEILSNRSFFKRFS